MILALLQLLEMNNNLALIEVKEEIPNGTHSPAVMLIYQCKKLEDDVRMLGLKIKHHEENINFMKTLRNKLDDSILDGQVSLGKYYTAGAPKPENEVYNPWQNEEETRDSIIRHSNTAATIYCQLKMHHEPQVSNLQWRKDIFGIVATLGQVDNDNINRFVSVLPTTKSLNLQRDVKQFSLHRDSIFPNLSDLGILFYATFSCKRTIVIRHVDFLKCFWFFVKCWSNLK